MKKNMIFICWISFSRRSQLISEKFNLKLYQIQSLKHKYVLSPVRYILQTIRTIKILFTEKPKIIFVQNPPIFAPLIVFLYSKINNSKFIIDSHSGALLAPWWKWSLPLHAFISRRAIATIVTNKHLEKMVKKWRAHAFILPDIPKNFPREKRVVLKKEFNIAVINTFAPDEPLKEILQAAKGLKEVQFYITGDTVQSKKENLDAAPSNVEFTNFLPDSEYISLLRSVDAIMVLTKNDHTMQRGACEAISLEKPIITSDWPILKEFFNKGTIHVNNSINGIREGIIKMRSHKDVLKKEITQLKKKKLIEWKKNFFNLNKMIQ